MPECIEYINDIRREAFNKVLLHARDIWIKDVTSIILGDETDLERRDIAMEFYSYLFDEKISEEFDALWSAVSNEIITELIISELRNLFRRLKVKKNEALSQFINKTGEKYKLRDWIIVKIKYKLLPAGSLAISIDFIDRKFEDYLTLIKSLKILKECNA